MFEPVSTDTLVITPTNAGEYLKLNTLEAQRSLSQRHVRVLAGKMLDGRFRTGSLAVAIKQYDGQPESRVLVNGQHQLWG